MEDFVVNPSLSEFDELNEINTAQLATAGGSTVAQPQTQSRHHPGYPTETES